MRARYNSRLACSRKISRCAASAYQNDGRSYACLAQRTGIPNNLRSRISLNLKRLNNQHLAFSAGPHFCIGTQLARLEGQIALLNLVQRFPEMKLTGPQPEWASTFGFRGLKSLPVTL